MSAEGSEGEPRELAATDANEPSKAATTIEYCARCGWLLRAAWVAQELLTTFENELAGVTLKPSALAGTFQVRVGEALVWCRKRDGGFPQVAELKRRVREHAAPGRPLGHIDRDADS
jgi:selenoprotein W-related protein